MAQAAQGTVPAGRGVGVSLRRLLPRGRTLPDDVWYRRHRALLWLLWAHVPALIMFGVARGYSVLHSVEEGMLVAVLAGVATVAKRRKRLAAAFVSLGLVTCSAVLVHLWGGVIEAHFHFFVVVVLLSLYEDWVPFLLAAAYVVLHHGLAGAIAPGSVYNHEDAVNHPWRWALIHGAFVTAAGIGSVMAWRLNEDVRSETEAAYHQARDSEERFKSAFDNAPIGMLLGSVAAGEDARFLQVNRAMCELTGYSREQLIGRTFRDITYPEDIETAAAPLERLINGELPSFQLEKRYLRPDGEVLWGHVTVSLVRDGAGKPLYVLGQVQDVTEQKRAQDQLTYQAYHDALTGLPNRRRMLADLEEGISTSSKEDPLVLTLFDLDGFKAYNDTFGHPAGDALLSRLGQQLEASVCGRGTAYRMGGDEFCAIGRLEGDGEAPLAEAAAEALKEQGEGFTITASHGSVLLPIEARSHAEALRKADQRMYARKRSGRASAGRQATDALLKALSERSADLGVHLSGVTDLCASVGEAVGISAERMAWLRQAAALHDVGKIAIPDAILNKPGPLDDAEWEFMRAHTVTGERILAAAPALAQAAKVVRSSHERFDGRGYPDGLAGEEIPLESRVILVCDAYDAMISDRPYRPGMTTEAALEELRRHSGTQFDPAVVEAFVAEISRRETPDRVPQAG